MKAQLERIQAFPQPQADLAEVVALTPSAPIRLLENPSLPEALPRAQADLAEVVELRPPAAMRSLENPSLPVARAQAQKIRLPEHPTPFEKF